MRHLAKHKSQANQDLLALYDLWFNSRLNCPKAFVITYCFSLKAFSLQSIYLMDAGSNISPIPQSRKHRQRCDYARDYL